MMVIDNVNIDIILYFLLFAILILLIWSLKDIISTNKNKDHNILMFLSRLFSKKQKATIKDILRNNYSKQTNSSKQAKYDNISEVDTKILNLSEDLENYKKSTDKFIDKVKKTINNLESENKELKTHKKRVEEFYKDSLQHVHKEVVPLTQYTQNDLRNRQDSLADKAKNVINKLKNKNLYPTWVSEPIINEIQKLKNFEGSTMLFKLIPYYTPEKIFEILSNLTNSFNKNRYNRKKELCNRADKLLTEIDGLRNLYAIDVIEYPLINKIKELKKDRGECFTLEQERALDVLLDLLNELKNNRYFMEALKQIRQMGKR